MAFWMFLLKTKGLPLPGLWPAIKVPWFFLAKANTLLKVDSDMFTWSLMALRGTLALQSSITTLFSSLERVWSTLHTWLRANGNWSSFLILAAKIVLYYLGRWNFVWFVPIYRRIKYNCSHDFSLKSKGRRTSCRSWFLAATISLRRYVPRYKLSSNAK